MIKAYIQDGKKYFEVYVAERDKNKKLIARRKRGITSERIAINLEFDFKTELRKLAGEAPRYTWDSWHKKFLQKLKLRSKNSTVMNYDGGVKKWIPKEWMVKSLEEITQTDVHDVIEKVGKTMAPITQKNIHRMIRTIFEEAITDGILSVNPAKGLRVVAPHVNQKVLTANEAEILLQQGKLLNHRFYPVWAFALKSGMRSGEMAALKWTDINFDNNLISVTKQWTRKDGTTPPKNGESRLVPISKDLRGFLLELRSGEPIPGDFVLPRLQEWARGDQAEVLKDFCSMIGITSVKFHDLRATFITNLLSQGVSLAKVMAIVGHRNMETTDIYLRLAGVEIRGATDALGYSIPNQDSLGNVIAIGSSRVEMLNCDDRR